MLSRAIILGSGNSISEGISQGLWSVLKNEITFGINEAIKFFDCTSYTFGDWTVYRDRFELYKNKELVIGRYDAHFIHQIDGALPCPKQDGLILLKSSGKWNGDEGLSKGLYLSVLTGALTLNLAIRLGFKEIYLLGFDNCEINGKTHFYQGIENAGVYNDYEGKPTCGIGKDNNGRFNTSVYNHSDVELNKIWTPFSCELGRCSIFNVSPLSRITVFPKIDYKEFFRTISNGSQINQDEIRQEIRTILQPFNQV
jgi:hypothetical protein